MGEKTAEEQEFYILEVTGSDSKFVKTDGEMVEIGEGIQAFAHNQNAPGAALEYWMIYELQTGAKLSFGCPTKERAIQFAIEETGGRVSRDYQARIDWYKKTYGRSPAVQVDGIEVIQEPGEREIKTCVRE